MTVKFLVVGVCAATVVIAGLNAQARIGLADQFYTTIRGSDRVQVERRRRAAPT